MEWIVFALLASVIWAIMNIIDKYIFTRWDLKPIVFLIFFSLIGLIAGIFIYFAIGFGTLSIINIALGLLAGALFMFMVLFYFKAVKIEEVSRVVPLFEVSPLFILIFAMIFLGEVFTTITYIGILLLVSGAFLISTKSLSNFKLGKAFWFMILSVLFLTFNQIITKYLLGFADFWTIFSWTRIGTFLATIPIFIVYFSQFKGVFNKHGNKAVSVITFSQVLSLLGIFFITIAVSDGYVTLANALSSTQPFFVLIFATIIGLFYPKFIREEVSKKLVLQKFIAVLLLVIGAILII